MFLFICNFRENSYASHSDADVGQSVIDRYSKVIKDFMDDAVSLTSSSTTNYPSPETSHNLFFDNATVAVMERLTLHDILVRIPMNHGDLGPNSHVGHTDHLCTRKMNSVPLSDFFAASSVVRGERRDYLGGGGLISSIWMGGSSIQSKKLDFIHFQDETERECAIDMKLHAHSAENKRMEPSAISYTKGMSPTDPQFLVLAAGFVLCFNFAARIW